jgi:hypothetical protein
MPRTYGEKVVDRLLADGACTSKERAAQLVTACPAISDTTRSVLLALINRDLLKTEARTHEHARIL